MKRQVSMLVALVCLAWCVPTWAEEPGARAGKLQDEPGLHKPLPEHKDFWSSYFSKRKTGASLRVGYRAFMVSDMLDREAWYESITVDFYPVSKLIRAGGGLEFGGDSTDRDNYLISGTIKGGVQWPWRVTPFFDFTLCFGALRWEMFHQENWSFAYQVGLEVGADFFVHDKWFVSTALGWRHIVFRHPGDSQVEPADVYFDSFTVQVSMGF